MGFLGEVVSWFTTAEHWRGPFGVPARVWEHLVLSAVPLALACAVALPVGVVLGHRRRGGAVAVAIANTWRAVPTFAVLVFAYKVWGLGNRPITLALFALAVPPILLNAYVGVSGVDAEVREAAKGMGMSGWESLRRVELPLALPLVMAGVRTGAVQVVATATLAAVIAGGGLGRFIVDGYAVQDHARVFAGAFVVALLSIATELGLGRLQRRFTPRGRDPLFDPAMSLMKGSNA